jgi:hypothetical protein
MPRLANSTRVMIGMVICFAIVASAIAMQRITQTSKSNPSAFACMRSYLYRNMGGHTFLRDEEILEQLSAYDFASDALVSTLDFQSDVGLVIDNRPWVQDSRAADFYALYLRLGEAEFRDLLERALGGRQRMDEAARILLDDFILFLRSSDCTEYVDPADRAYRPTEKELSCVLDFLGKQGMRRTNSTALGLFQDYYFSKETLLDWQEFRLGLFNSFVAPRKRNYKTAAYFALYVRLGDNAFVSLANDLVMPTVAQYPSSHLLAGLADLLAFFRQYECT